jgi:IS1 family transposase
VNLDRSSIVCTGVNKLSSADRVGVVAALVEGNSIRSTVRMTGVAKNTVTKLLVELGAACTRHHDKAVRNVAAKRIQADEIWSFVYAKAKNAKPEMKEAGTAGDCWTWTAMDSDSKLMLSWLVGPRTPPMAYALIQDLALRLSTPHPQLTTDGLPWYAQAVEYFFGIDVDYAIVEKHYGKVAPEKSAAARYSPARFTGSKRETICGSPDPKHVSTSHVERQNLTMRMGMRRFTRLTNAFSKKVQNLEAAVALHFTYYNFARVHQTLRVTPAMEAGLSDHAWTLEEIVALLA